MTQIEIIDRFCDITSQQSDMIKKLVNIIAQSNVVDEEIMETLLNDQSEIDHELDVVEYGNRDNIC